MYRLGDSGIFGNRVGDALKSIGEPPAYLDMVVLNQDIERLEVLYRQAGFREASVEATIDTTASQRIEVTFDVEQGPTTFVRKVTYLAAGLDEEQVRRMVAASLLRRKAEEEHASADAFIAGDQRFSEALLHEERRRMLDFLREEGYAAITRDSIRAVVARAAPDSFDIDFLVGTGPRYRVGDIRFNVVGPETDVSVEVDTSADQRAQDGLVTARVAGDRKLKPRFLYEGLQFQPGEWYSQEKVLATKRWLEATGIFSFTRIDPAWERTRNDSIPVLPFQIDAETRERHRMQFETFMLQRSGVLETSDNEIGMGLGVTYENANLLGGGEAFRVNTTGSLTGVQSAQAEISTSLTLPYATAPLKGLASRLDLYDTRTQFSLSFLTARREELLFVIRGRGTARLRFEMQHSPTEVSFVDVFDLSLSNPDVLPGFEDDSVSVIARILNNITDPVRREQAEEDYTVPQINSVLRYTFRSANVNPLRRDVGYSREGSLEIGANLLPYVLDRYVHTPGVVEGRIPGIPLFRGSGSQSELIYRQYIRFSGDIRRYRPISSNAVLAWKAFGGVAQPIGQADLVPLDRRFLSGGASSVRGWELSALGPGVLSSSVDTLESFGGDIKMEASVELRSTMIRNLLAADWILTFFGDAGNVWFGPRNPGNEEGRFRLSSFYRELGVGGGVGIRLAWEYLILRLDLAYRVYDPAREGPFIDNAFRGPRLHFGIGHAF